jgi:hypothetical protein
MLRSPSVRCTWIIALLACALPACSADAVVAPEPAETTPGAIIALGEDGRPLTLFQVQASTGAERGDRILFVNIFQVTPSSYAEARVLARDPALEIRSRNYLIALPAVVSAPHEVVWFRSLEP